MSYFPPASIMLGPFRHCQIYVTNPSMEQFRVMVCSELIEGVAVVLSDKGSRKLITTQNDISLKKTQFTLFAPENTIDILSLVLLIFTEDMFKLTLLTCLSDAERLSGLVTVNERKR